MIKNHNIKLLEVQNCTKMKNVLWIEIIWMTIYWVLAGAKNQDNEIVLVVIICPAWPLSEIERKQKERLVHWPC